MLKKIDFGFALLTFILGIYVVLEGFSYGFTAADGQPGSGLFPIIVGFALIFSAPLMCFVAGLITSVFKKNLAC
jgi:hypothetical protein